MTSSRRCRTLRRPSDPPATKNAGSRKARSRCCHAAIRRSPRRSSRSTREASERSNREISHIVAVPSRRGRGERAVRARIVADLSVIDRQTVFDYLVGHSAFWGSRLEPAWTTIPGDAGRRGRAEEARAAWYSRDARACDDRRSARGARRPDARDLGVISGRVPRAHEDLHSPGAIRPDAA